MVCNFLHTQNSFSFPGMFLVNISTNAPVTLSFPVTCPSFYPLHMLSQHFIRKAIEGHKNGNKCHWTPIVFAPTQIPQSIVCLTLHMCSPIYPPINLSYIFSISEETVDVTTLYQHAHKVFKKCNEKQTFFWIIIMNELMTGINFKAMQIPSVCIYLSLKWRFMIGNNFPIITSVFLRKTLLFVMLMQLYASVTQGCNDISLWKHLNNSGNCFPVLFPDLNPTFAMFILLCNLSPLTQAEYIPPRIMCAEYFTGW